MGKVQACHTAKFKLEVVRYAQEHGKKAAGRKFDLEVQIIIRLKFFGKHSVPHNSTSACLTSSVYTTDRLTCNVFSSTTFKCHANSMIQYVPQHYMKSATCTSSKQTGLNH
jgi:hypothetical protein